MKAEIQIPMSPLEIVKEKETLSYNKFKKTFNEAYNFLKRSNIDFFIAGGAPFFLLFEILEKDEKERLLKINKEVNTDIDVYFYTLKDLKLMKTYFEHFNIRIFKRTKFATTYTFEDMAIQLIEKIGKSPIDIVQKFDINVCRTYIENNKIKTAFEFDKKIPEITIQKENFCISTFSRIIKYNKRGIPINKKNISAVIKELWDKNTYLEHYYDGSNISFRELFLNMLLSKNNQEFYNFVLECMLNENFDKYLIEILIILKTSYFGKNIIKRLKNILTEKNKLFAIIILYKVFNDLEFEPIIKEKYPEYIF